MPMQTNMDSLVQTVNERSMNSRKLNERRTLLRRLNHSAQPEDIIISSDVIKHIKDIAKHFEITLKNSDELEHTFTKLANTRWNYMTVNEARRIGEFVSDSLRGVVLYDEHTFTFYYKGDKSKYEMYLEEVDCWKKRSWWYRRNNSCPTLSQATFAKDLITE